jgi:hypothetical protein
MVCGIVGLVLCFSPLLAFILGVVGIVFGGIVLNRRGRGHGFAVTGLVCGIVAIVMAIIVLLIAISLEASRSRSRQYFHREGPGTAVAVSHERVVTEW